MFSKSPNKNLLSRNCHRFTVKTRFSLSLKRIFHISGTIRMKEINLIFSWVSTSQLFRNDFKLDLICIFLSVRADQNITFRVWTPCVYTNLIRGIFFSITNSLQHNCADSKLAFLDVFPVHWEPFFRNIQRPNATFVFFEILRLDWLDLDALGSSACEFHEVQFSW